MVNNDYQEIPYSVLRAVKKANSELFMYEFENHTQQNIRFINEGLHYSRFIARAVINELKQTK